METSLKDARGQVVRELPGGSEGAKLHLQLEDRTMVLKFTPEQLFQFYEQLEQIQASIDGICQ